jgi:hypothetical protein
VPSALQLTPHNDTGLDIAATSIGSQHNLHPDLSLSIARVSNIRSIGHYA